MDRKGQRKYELERYKKNRSISNYRFFVISADKNNVIYIIHKKVSTKAISITSCHSKWYFSSSEDKHISEIITVGSFLKRVRKSDVKIIIYESNDTHQSFDSFDEVRQYMLIQKIAGV